MSHQSTHALFIPDLDSLDYYSTAEAMLKLIKIDIFFMLLVIITWIGPIFLPVSNIPYKSIRQYCDFIISWLVIYTVAVQTAHRRRRRRRKKR